MTRTEVCKERVKYAKERLTLWEDQDKHKDGQDPYTRLRIRFLRELLIAEEDHLEYARQHKL